MTGRTGRIIRNGVSHWSASASVPSWRDRDPWPDCESWPSSSRSRSSSEPSCPGLRRFLRAPAISVGPPAPVSPTAGPAYMQGCLHRQDQYLPHSWLVTQPHHLAASSSRRHGPPVRCRQSRSGKLAGLSQASRPAQVNRLTISCARASRNRSSAGRGSAGPDAATRRAAQRRQPGAEHACRHT